MSESVSKLLTEVRKYAPGMQDCDKAQAAMAAASQDLDQAITKVGEAIAKVRDAITKVMFTEAHYLFIICMFIVYLLYYGVTRI